MDQEITGGPSAAQVPLEMVSPHATSLVLLVI